VIRTFVRCLAALAAVLSGSAAAVERQPIMGPSEVLRGSFEQERHLEGFREPLRSSGVFSLSPQGGIIWRVETPFPIVTVITPAGLIQESEGVTLTQLPGARMQGLFGITNILNNVLIGDWSALNAEFEVATSEEQGGWRIEAKPREAFLRSLIAQISISGVRFADRVEIRRPGGDFDRLIFRDQSIAPQFNDDEKLLLSRVAR